MAYYEAMRQAAAEEFTEDNEPTLNGFLQDCFQAGMPVQRYVAWQDLKQEVEDLMLHTQNVMQREEAQQQEAQQQDENQPGDDYRRGYGRGKLTAYDLVLEIMGHHSSAIFRV